MCLTQVIALAATQVGRSPWTARDASVPLPERRQVLRNQRKTRYHPPTRTPARGPISSSNLLPRPQPSVLISLSSFFFGLRLGKMVKRLGQSLALIAMMASVIIAQCAVSCSLQSIAGSPASHASRVDADRTGHACCPHRGAPKPKQQKDGIPCPHPVPAADDARLSNSSASFNPIPAVIVTGLSHEYRPQLAEIDLESLTDRGSSDLLHLSSILILRI